jgi:hypothetical protein
MGSRISFMAFLGRIEPSGSSSIFTSFASILNTSLRQAIDSFLQHFRAKSKHREDYDHTSYYEDPFFTGA